MFRKLTITVTAAAMALTSFAATPARADDDDVAKALAALVGIAIVGKIVHDEKKKKKKKHPGTVKPRPLPPQVTRDTIPSRCLREYETSRGWITLYARRCLEKHYLYAHELPRDCKRRVHTYQGKRVGFKPRCLRRWGYRVAVIQ